MPTQRAIAAFDLDGTCLEGQSGILLACYLAKHGFIKKHELTALAWWGIRYKLHLPHAQDTARRLIFNGLANLPREQVEQLFDKFYTEVVRPRLRHMAQIEVAARKAEGCTCILVSATFDLIAHRAAEDLGCDEAISTKMLMGETGYLPKVDGEVVSGGEKYTSLARFADAHFGHGLWKLVYAYGDHHSDVPILEKAEHAFCVCPGKTLKAEAKRRGWEILLWH